MYIVNLEKKLPNKNLRTVFTPDNLSSLLNDFPFSSQAAFYKLLSLFIQFVLCLKNDTFQMYIKLASYQS